MRKTSLFFALSSILFWSSTGLSFSDNFILDNLNPESFHFLGSPTTETEANILEKQHLVKIISEPQNNLIHNIILEVDDNGRLINLVRETEDKSDRQVVNMLELIKKPAVLARASDRDILLLSCFNCTPESGGNLKLDYLYNGITKKYRDLKMKLQFSKASSWELYTENKKNHIKSLRLVPRKIFGQLVGIKRITINSFKKHLR